MKGKIEEKKRIGRRKEVKNWKTGGILVMADGKRKMRKGGTGV